MGCCSNKVSIAPAVRRYHVALDNTIDGSPVPRHRTHNRVRHNLEEEETIYECTHWSNEISANNCNRNRTKYCCRLILLKENIIGIQLTSMSKTDSHMSNSLTKTVIAQSYCRMFCLVWFATLSRKEHYYSYIVCPCNILTHYIKDLQLRRKQLKGNNVILTPVFS